MNENVSFEDNLKKLETIVNELEQGDIPLEKALDQFKEGVKLSNQLQSTLTNAKHTLTKMMNDDGEEVTFDRDQKDDKGNQSNDQK